MNGIMMYMSGNSLQIFSIMMVFMLFKGPIQGLINTNSAFAKFETDGTKGKLLGVKALYVVMQLLLLALGVWKVNGMGLLPYVFPIPSYVGAPRPHPSYSVCMLANSKFIQNYEVGLVGVGVRTAAYGAGVFCSWVTAYVTSRSIPYKSK